jgi:hypothetical protein
VRGRTGCCFLITKIVLFLLLSSEPAEFRIGKKESLQCGVLEGINVKEHPFLLLFILEIHGSHWFISFTNSWNSFGAILHYFSRIMPCTCISSRCCLIELQTVRELLCTLASLVMYALFYKKIFVYPLT